MSEDGQQEILSRHNISWLYHITHIENLFSIFDSGLHPHELAHKYHCPTDISNLEVNQRRSKRDSIYNLPIHEYVPLYFAPKNPMSYKNKDIRELAILHIDKEVALKPNVVFTDGNAASNFTKIYGHIKDLDGLDWKCLKAKYWKDFPDGSRKRCSELLVPKTISKDYIKQISVKTERIRRELIEYQLPEPSTYECEDLPSPSEDLFYGVPVYANPDYFF